MPEKVKRALKKAGKKKGLSGKKLDRFVYGTMTNMEKAKALEKA
jgi:hypothetical protein